jgi:hypothetical protein
MHLARLSLQFVEIIRHSFLRSLLKTLVEWIVLEKVGLMVPNSGVTQNPETKGTP